MFLVNLYTELRLFYDLLLGDVQSRENLCWCNSNVSQNFVNGFDITCYAIIVYLTC